MSDRSSKELFPTYEQLRAGWLQMQAERDEAIAQVNRLTAENAGLRQFREWAEPQIVTHGEDVLTIERLTAERDRLREVLREAKHRFVDILDKLPRLKNRDVWLMADDGAKKAFAALAGERKGRCCDDRASD
jgi:hypothetical protein